jgi:excisionase family DNA binding protein
VPPEPLTLFTIAEEASPSASSAHRRSTGSTAAPAPPYRDFPANCTSASPAAENAGVDDAPPIAEHGVRLLLKPAEAARALGIGRSKLYELIAAGVVDSVLIGSARRIPADALSTYIDSLRHPQLP